MLLNKLKIIFYESLVQFQIIAACGGVLGHRNENKFIMFFLFIAALSDCCIFTTKNCWNFLVIARTCLLYYPAGEDALSFQ